MDPHVAKARARLAALSRPDAGNEAQRIEARRDLKAANLTAAVERITASWPPLTDQQIDNVVAILRAGA
jgi:hypothetical protein